MARRRLEFSDPHMGSRGLHEEATRKRNELSKNELKAIRNAKKNGIGEPASNHTFLDSDKPVKLPRRS